MIEPGNKAPPIGRQAKKPTPPGFKRRSPRHAFGGNSEATPQDGKQTKTTTLRNPQNFGYEVSHLRGSCQHDVLKAEGLVIDHKRTELGPVVAAQLLGHTITGNGAYQCCTMRRSPRNTLHIGPVVEHLRAERHTIDDTTLSLTTPLLRKHVSRSAARQVSLRSGAHRQTADPPPGETASSP